MKTFAILFTGAAALALSACGSADKPADAPDVTVVEDGEPVVTETTVVRDADGTDNSAPDTVTVGTDGVKVDVDSNNTRVKADQDGASVSVSD
jgi:archaellum component FlaG (FlaF/FlaG flagellin family)